MRIGRFGAAILGALTFAGSGLASRVAAAEGRAVGVGLTLGVPSGITGKIYLGTRPFAVQLGLGVTNLGPEEASGLQVHAEVVWHPFVLVRDQTFTIPAYFGLGARVLLEDDDPGGGDTRVGARVPVGVLVDFTRVPLDLYAELALVIDVVTGDAPGGGDDERLTLQGGMGLRTYF